MTICIRLQVNDPVIESRYPYRTGVIQEIVIVPNGINELSLVALLRVRFDGGGEMVSTSNQFKIVDGYSYAEFYPSTMLTSDLPTE